MPCAVVCRRRYTTCPNQPSHEFAQYIRDLLKKGSLEEEPVYGKVKLVTLASVEKLKAEREAKAGKE